MSKKRRGTRRALPTENISAVLARHVDELVFEEARARKEKGEKTVLQQNEEEEGHESDDETCFAKDHIYILSEFERRPEGSGNYVTYEQYWKDRREKEVREKAAVPAPAVTITKAKITSKKQRRKVKCCDPFCLPLLGVRRCAENCRCEPKKEESTEAPPVGRQSGRAGRQSS